MISTLVPNKSLTLVTSDYKTITVRSDHPNWNKIMEAFKVKDEASIVKLANMKSVFEDFDSNKETIKVVGNSVFYKGTALFGLDVQRILEFSSNGYPKESMINFLEKKLQNPSHRSIEQLYPFLENGGMPITPDGDFLAYKGVQENWYSVHSGTLTLLSGKADGPENKGHIFNGIDSVIECPRNEVCDDFDNACAQGLHAGSLDYAKGWGSKVIIVKINPKDVVCVPKEFSYGKLRCNRYEVVGECTTLALLPNTYTTEFSPDIDKKEVVDESINEGWDEDQYSHSEDDHDELDEYEKGYERGWDDADCDLVCSVNSYEDQNDWGMGYLDGYEDCKLEKNPLPIKEKEVNTDTSSYSDGYNSGFKDGKNHSSRKYYDDDLNKNYYVNGYNNGYRDGRNDYKK